MTWGAPGCPSTPHRPRTGWPGEEPARDPVPLRTAQTINANGKWDVLTSGHRAVGSPLEISGNGQLGCTDSINVQAPLSIQASIRQAVKRLLGEVPRSYENFLQYTLGLLQRVHGRGCDPHRLGGQVRLLNFAAKVETTLQCR